MSQRDDVLPGSSGGASPPRTSLSELALLFLRLGATSFGGPAVHIAMMHDEVVVRRRWLTEDRFLDLLSATNLIPGPNSTELAIHIGWHRRRWSGLLVAGLAFILPAMLITAACGWAYLHYSTLPSVGWLLRGVKPMILAVVVQAIWVLAPKAARDTPLRLLAGAGLVLVAVGVHELAVLFGLGAAAVLVTRRGPGGEPPLPASPSSPSSPVFGVRPDPSPGSSHSGKLQVSPLATGAAAGATVATLGTVASSPGLSALFWVFVKTGSVLFGSGYVLLAFLRADLVQRLHWLTEGQLVDAIAVGQVTPGPVFTTATFVGYLLAGPWGALVATAGIFLPAFLFVALSGPLVPRLRSSRTAGAFLDGVNVASLALMAVATAQLARAAMVDLPTALLGLAGAVLLLRFKLGPTWLIAVGAVAGWLLHLARP